MSSEKKSKTKVFSPNQILLGFFLGSFPAFSYLFYKNAMALGKEKNAKFYVIIGIIATIIYIPLTYYIFDVLFVDTIPNGLDYGLLIGIAIAMSYLAKHLFMDKEAIKASKKYTFQ